MTKLLLISLAAIAIPSIVVVAGGLLMREVSGRCDIQVDLLQGKFTGYKFSDVEENWKALEEGGGLGAERRLLQFDLLFAAVYSTALALCIWLVWTKLDPGFSVSWLLIPVVIAFLADCLETWILLNQLNHFNGSELDPAQAGPLAVASIATRVKWVAGALSFVTLYALVGVTLFSRLRS